MEIGFMMGFAIVFGVMGFLFVSIAILQNYIPEEVLILMDEF